jgi:hypothetical protein
VSSSPAVHDTSEREILSIPSALTRVADPAGRDAFDVGLADDGDQNLFGPPAGEEQELRVVDATPELRDAEVLDRAGLVSRRLVR